MADEVQPVRQKVESIADLHRDAERQVSRHQRIVEVFMAQLDRPRTLYGFLALVVAWLGINALVPSLRWDHPPFHYLQGLLGLISVTTTSVVLITQRRWLLRTEQHAQLDLHINLLAEEKIAKLVALVEELRRDLPAVPQRHDPEAAAMSRGTDARELTEELERSQDRSKGGTEPGPASPGPRSARKG